MSEPLTVTVRIPKELAKELDSKVEPRYRSEYIRQAIIDKLRRGSNEPPTRDRNDEINGLKDRISALEDAIKDLGKKGREVQVPALLEDISLDETDRQIIGYLVEHKSATTRELEKVVNLRRIMILERTKQIENKYEEKLGRPFLKFIRGKRDGKRQAWWLADS
jgi:Arc/MetJ-type ribon-helix-helix transcriptional regulator